MTAPDIDDLYRAATDWQKDILDELRRKAGHIWECYSPDGEHSCWTNTADDIVCEQCGTPRRED